jgi:hypothetical protein
MDMWNPYIAATKSRVTGLETRQGVGDQRIAEAFLGRRYPKNAEKNGVIYKKY